AAVQLVPARGSRSRNPAKPRRGGRHLSVRLTVLWHVAEAAASFGDLFAACPSRAGPPASAAALGLDHSRRGALMLVMGISCYYHDSAVAIVDEKEIKWAILEERLSRQKHDRRFPALALARGLQACGIAVD